MYGVVAKTPDISAVVAPNFKPGGPAPRSPNASLGRIYCDFTARVKKTTGRIASALVPSLYAAQAVPPQNPAVIPTPQPTPAVVVPAGTQDSAMVAITQAAPPTTPRLNQMPVILSGAIDNARIRMRENMRYVDQSAVELHKKFAISVACTIFVLVGAPIALRFPRGGVGLVIGVSLVIFGIYYIGLIAGESLANENIVSPFLSMWAANILLTIVGVILLARMGRESATTRGGDFREMLEIVRNVFRRDRVVRPHRTGAR